MKKYSISEIKRAMRRVFRRRRGESFPEDELWVESWDQSLVDKAQHPKNLEKALKQLEAELKRNGGKNEP